MIAEWEEIVTVREAERNAPPGLAKWYKNGMWKRTFAGASVQAWQQLRYVFVMSQPCVLTRFLAAPISW